MIDLNELFVGDYVHLVRTENGKLWHNGPRLVRVHAILPEPMHDGSQVMVEYRTGWLRWVRPEQIEWARPRTIERRLFERDPYEDANEAEHQHRLDRYMWKYGAKIGNLGPNDGGVWKPTTRKQNGDGDA